MTNKEKEVISFVAGCVAVLSIDNPRFSTNDTNRLFGIAEEFEPHLKNDEVEMEFNVVGFKNSDKGHASGLITENGFTLSLMDANGDEVPLNKEAILDFVKNHPKEKKV